MAVLSAVVRLPELGSHVNYLHYIFRVVGAYRVSCILQQPRYSTLALGNALDSAVPLIALQAFAGLRIRKLHVDAMSE